MQWPSLKYYCPSFSWLSKKLRATFALPSMPCNTLSSPLSLLSVLTPFFLFQTRQDPHLTRCEHPDKSKIPAGIPLFLWVIFFFPLSMCPLAGLSDAIQLPNWDTPSTSVCDSPRFPDISGQIFGVLFPKQVNYRRPPSSLSHPSNRGGQVVPFRYLRLNPTLRLGSTIPSIINSPPSVFRLAQLLLVFPASRLIVRCPPRLFLVFSCSFRLWRARRRPFFLRDPLTISPPQVTPLPVLRIMSNSFPFLMLKCLKLLFVQPIIVTFSDRVTSPLYPPWSEHILLGWKTFWAKAHLYAL